MRFGESSAGVRSITAWQRVIHQTRPRYVISAQPSIHPTPVDSRPTQALLTSLAKSACRNPSLYKSSDFLYQSQNAQQSCSLESNRLSLKIRNQCQVSITGPCFYFYSDMDFSSNIFRPKLDVILFTNCHRNFLLR